MVLFNKMLIKMKTILILLLIFLNCSCIPNKNDVRSAIKGEWMFLKAIPPDTCSKCASPCYLNFGYMNYGIWRMVLTDKKCQCKSYFKYFINPDSNSMEIVFSPTYKYDQLCIKDDTLSFHNTESGRKIFYLKYNKGNYSYLRDCIFKKDYFDLN